MVIHFVIECVYHYRLCQMSIRLRAGVVKRNLKKD